MDTRFFNKLFALLLIGSYLFSIDLPCTNEVKRPKEFKTPVGGLLLNYPFVRERVSGVLLGEGGDRYRRVNGTLGWEIERRAYMKFSVDYLAEKFRYRLSSGTVGKDIQQIIGGCGVGSELGNCWIPFLSFVGYYGYSFSRALPSSLCTLFSTSWVVKQWISGASVAGGKGGVMVVPYYSLKLLFDGYYDWVKFNATHHSTKVHSGFGWSVGLSQEIYPDVMALGGRAEFRMPYDFYQLFLSSILTDDVRLSAQGSYTKGKIGLPNIKTAGLILSVDFGGHPRAWTKNKREKTPYQEMVDRERRAREGVRKEDVSQRSGCSHASGLTGLSSFVSEPAVKSPTVFSRAQQKRVP